MREPATPFSVFSADIDRFYYGILASGSTAGIRSIRFCMRSSGPCPTHHILLLLFIILNSVAGAGAEAPPQRVLVNGTAQMKCDIATSMTNDKALLVVWYKNNLPIYRYVAIEN